MNTYKFTLTIFMMTLLFCTLFTQAAASTFLQGRLEQSNVTKSVPGSESTKDSSVNPIETVQPDTTPLSIAPQYSVLAPPANSYPRLYEGYWQCLTTVTYSSVNTIRVGTKIDCNITFFRNTDNRTCAYFYPASWTEAKGTVLKSSKLEVYTERIDYFNCANQREIWMAHSQDHFVLVNPVSIIAESFVEQTHNGRKIGNYRTTSILSKLAIP